MAFLRRTVLQFFDILNYYHRASSVFHQPGKVVLRRAEKIEFTPAEQQFLVACASSFNFEVDYSGGLPQKEISVTKLANATILGNSGAVVWQQKIVTESAFDLRRLALSPAWRTPAFMPAKKKKGVYTAVFHFPWAETSNYHWFLDCLPRVYALVKTIKEPCVFIMPENVPDFQQETLAFVLDDYPNFKIETIGKHEKWRCENFLLPSFVANHASGFLPKEVSEFLREKIFKGYKVAEKEPIRRIYISRSRATKRRILNENELLPILKKYDFEIVFPEQFSYQDQVKLFAESRFIVGPHGAGFTNTLFAKNPTVFELHPASAVKPHYFLLSKGLGFDYQYLIGSEADAKLDFTVSVPAFEEKLKEILS